MRGPYGGGGSVEGDRAFCEVTEELFTEELAEIAEEFDVGTIADAFSGSAGGSGGGVD